MEGIFCITFFFHDLSVFVIDLPFLFSTETGDQSQVLQFKRVINCMTKL